MTRTTQNLPGDPFPGRYRITSRAVLPLRMHGTFSFSEAYDLCCEWNSQHTTRDMAWPDRDYEGA